VPTALFDELFDEQFARARAFWPEGARLWDAHTHLGVDDDGFRLSPEELVDAMRADGVERSFTFPLNDPDRIPGYRVPNDRVMAWAERSGGALVPFCRLDLTADPVAEAERCLAAGARGIKLHPRAQNFDFGERGLDPVFRVAAKHRVPILIHAGRGLPAIADDLRHLVERHPEAQLILAHAAIADLEHIGRTLLDHPNVLYDTSVWATNDLRALFAIAAPEQIVFASDLPYGRPRVNQIQISVVLRRAGATPEQVSGILWGNAERAARGEPAATLSPPLLERDRHVPLKRARIHDYLVMASTLLWTRHPDMPGALTLAVRACDVNGDAAFTEIATLIETAQELWSQSLSLDDEDMARPFNRGAFRLLQIADAHVLDC
jgi:predicted TIM-barrel fold metal-dependent hydrolase